MHYAGVGLWEHLLVNHGANYPIIRFILVLSRDYYHGPCLLLLTNSSLLRLLDQKNLLSIFLPHIIFHFFFKNCHLLIDTLIVMSLIDFHPAKNIILFDGPAIICESGGRSEGIFCP
jgi:hypothetical protein